MIKKSFIIISFFVIIIIRLFIINIVDKEKYEDLLDKKNNKYVYGEVYPRGRILDRNGKVLVDNIGIKAIYYKDSSNMSVDKKIAIAKELAQIINIDINEKSLINYYLVTHNNGDDLITNEEYDLYNKRKISSKDILNLKKERVTDEMLNSMSLIDKKSATIYYLMNKGYSYQKKLIAKDISDLEYSKIIDSNIEGITTELKWERVYLYGDTLKDIFGSLGNITKEDKEKYLKNGYSLDDIVGISYLELYYEDYLKGSKDLYKVNSDNSLSLINKGSNGNDLVLSIDIDIQLKLEEVLKTYLLYAKNLKNTDYFSELYSILGDPNTGEILALSGIKYKDNNFYNNNINLITSSFTVGSIVKMGTISAGYKYNVIDINTSVVDSCMKLYQVPMKCSYKRLGRVNDMEAIAKSSNYYQFNIALGLTGNKYKYDMKLETTKEDFNKLRSMYAEYGLNTITGIDLPNEKTGIIGDNNSSDLLLNLSIGQYDTYTPIELYQYVNTIANNGHKRKPQLMKQIVNDKEIIKNNSYDVESVVSLDKKYLERLKDAMHLACTNGTARGYIDLKYKPAGKTGTSETFIDTNDDNIMDTKTTSIAFLGFAPYDEAKYSIVVLAPNLYVNKNYSYSKIYITRFISKDITNFLFENY